MSKTITIRLNEDIYNLFKKAADGERRNLANYMEYATLSHLTKEAYVSNEEMDSILNNDELVRSLRKGISDVKEGKFSFVE